MHLYRCLHESGGTHVIVPITINYERIPEQKVLIEEACGNSKKVLRLSDLMVWLKVSSPTLYFQFLTRSSAQLMVILYVRMHFSEISRWERSIYHLLHH
jgi:hypothetical protein